MPQSQARHRNSNHSSRNMSPARSPNTQPLQQLPPIHLQPNDFPPLSLSTSPVKRNSPAGGAWSTQGHRPIFTSNSVEQPVSGTPLGSALFKHQGGGNGSGTERPYDDRSFERPPPKTNAELFNPNAASGSKSPSPSVQEKADKERSLRTETIASSILIDSMGSLKIQGSNGGKRPDSVEGEHVAKDSNNVRANGNDAMSLGSGILPIPKDVSSSGMIAS